ncbi:MAG: Gfo/Idh/MocA family oxidoreductase [Chloroflexi bacterium]|nr:Gfo/Idh/MocA family oxidoreductase [Chloroflexota bacterium]
MIRAAVIGVGSMGKNHARVFAEMEETELVAVADPARAVPVADIYKVRPYADYREMLAREAPDVVSVVVPTALHGQVAREAAAAGTHVFVEKPLASSLEEGRSIIEAARTADVRLAVGHIERFNPAVLALRERLEAGDLGRIFQLHARRVGPFPSRIEDVGVVFDLATHELNVMEYLAESAVESLYAETQRAIHPSHEDLLSGVLKFASGAVGVLDINWLTPTKIRQLSIIGERGLFVVNYLTQELFFYENDYTNNHWDRLAAIMGVAEGKMVKHGVRRKEPLRAELEEFIASVREGREPLVGGEEGLRAVFLAQKMVESGLNRQAVRV